MTKQFHPGHEFRVCQKCYGRSFCKDVKAHTCRTLRRIYVCQKCGHRWFTVEVRCQEYAVDLSIVHLAVESAFKPVYKYKEYDFSIIPIGESILIPYTDCTIDGVRSVQTKIHKRGLMRFSIRSMANGIRVWRMG